jgi:phage tail sheath protein FI
VIATASIPGLRFRAEAAPPAPSPLRSDVAAFVGRTRRGPVGQPVRVAGLREAMQLFGGLRADAATPYALRGYFENEGQVAHVVRLLGAAASTASATWSVATLSAASGFSAQTYTVAASSPGAWAEGTEVRLDYRRDGVTGGPEVDVTVRAPDEPAELFSAVAPADLPALPSALITIQPLPGPPPSGPSPGPRSRAFALTLTGGADDPPSFAEYQTALAVLAEVPEPALVAAPDLHGDLPADVDRYQLLAEALAAAAALHDRLVLIDVPAEAADARAAVAWLDGLRAVTARAAWRAGDVYHPWLWVPDPLGGVASPLRALAPSGHLAGVISRLDRERGAHHTPANAPIYEAVDVLRVYGSDDGGLLEDSGLNLLRCRCGRGLQVWGGRTIDTQDPVGRFVAHRRLIHRLVRAIRRVAEPLAFDVNGPQLWLTFTRAITAVLLEAWRAGALMGTRAEEAFQVKCDAQTNPPADVDNGLCLCLVSVAPAVPMEFITIRIAVSADGRLEVTA